MSYTYDKFSQALRTLKADVMWSYTTESNFAPASQDEFNKIEWITGEDSGGSAITTNTCPYSEITWTKLKAEMDKL